MWYILSMRFYLVFVGVFWHVVKPYLSDDDRERFSTLKNINSDIGRGQFSFFHICDISHSNVVCVSCTR